MLDLEQVGAGDDFFAAGGHSLLAIRVLSRLRDAFGVELEVRQLFENPTVAGLAAVLASARITESEPITPVPRGGALPTSFAQERLWFLEEMQPGDFTYNIPLAMRFAGQFHVAAFAAALEKVSERHESLRTSFQVRGGEPVQVIAAPGRRALPLVDLGSLPLGRSEDLGRRLARRRSASGLRLVPGAAVADHAPASGRSRARGAGELPPRRRRRLVGRGVRA